MLPSVSIIVPVYNVERYLAQCLSSLQNQTLQDIEIICVNDGSTDGSANVVRTFIENDKRFSLIEQENQGLSGARNSGLKAAKGKYVYFMDSDDWLDQDAMQTCLEQAEKYKLDIVCFDTQSFADDEYDGNLIMASSRTDILKDISWKPQKAIVLYYKMLSRKCFQASAYRNFIRRTLLIDSGLNYEERLIHEDELYTPQLYALADRMMYIPLSFFHRRVRAGSIMTTRKKEDELSTFRHIEEELIHISNDYGLIKGWLIRYRAKQLCEYTVDYAHSNNMLEADLTYEKQHIKKLKIIQKVRKLFTGEFIRFCLVGVLATALHYGLYWLLINLITPTHIDNTLWINIAYAIGYMISFCCNFLLSNYFTFRTKPDFVKLLGMAGAHGLNFLNHMLLLNFFVWLGVSENLAPIPVYLIAVPINFIMVRFAFKHKF